MFNYISRLEIGTYSLASTIHNVSIMCSINHHPCTTYGVLERTINFVPKMSKTISINVIIFECLLPHLRSKVANVEVV